MNQAVIIATIALMQAVAVTLIGGLLNRESKKRKEEHGKMDKRAEIRAEENLLSMKLMSANTDLTIATALAVQEGKTNGKMASALVKAEKAQHDYYNFIDSVASRQITN